MAKRGRKKKSKVTSLSAADKGHLKRILAKVRQIKQNKAANGQPSGKNTALIIQLQASLAAAMANYNRILTTENVSSPAVQNNLKVISQQIVMLQQQIGKASIG